jgi:crotonobetainyl-CoA:carnitine CoA-transferase CaiB-like acyl-CoA transferase
MKPLVGIRIADFTFHAAGPFCTHMLSQLGAECIKVETKLRPDIFRKPHFIYGRTTAASFDQVASNKLSIRINLKNPKGIALAKRVVGISDIASESFRPGVFKRLGLGYDDLKAIKSDIIMVSVSASGQSGPDSGFAGYAPLFAAWGGLGYLTGFADGPPVEMRHVMDHTIGMNAALGVMAALHRRRRTGVGSHVDVSGREVAASLVGEALLQAASGGTPTRIGNAQPGASPHGLYPTRDDDRWLSIAVTTDDHWQRFARVIDRADLLNDQKLTTGPQRFAAREMLDGITEAWTKTQSGEAAQETLQQAGVPAHLSWNMRDITEDKHLRARKMVVDVHDSAGNTRAAISVPMRLSKSETGMDRGTPELGCGEDYVYGDLLGMSTRERAALAEEQVIY